LSLELILRELNERKSRRFILDEYCFKEQLDFINDPARFKTAVCSRRAGKTEACAADLIWTAMNNEGVVCLYITLSRANAKRLIWPIMNRVNKYFNLGFKPNESELSLTHQKTGSVIYLSGAKDKSEIEKFRGLATKKVYVDEAQSFRAYIKELIDEVLGATLFDYNGVVCLTGTPGPIPAGYFHDAAHSEGWAHHTWTLHVNPHIERKSGKKVQDLINEELARMKVDITDPKVQREYFAKWVVDLNSLVLKYDKVLNHSDIIPACQSHVIGVDIGHDDADAIAVIGWNDNSPKAYLVDEDIKPKQGITELADKIAAYVGRYKPNAIVMDTGGLGKKIAEEIRRRFGLPIIAAEKSRKFEHLEILNDALRRGDFIARSDSQFAHDCMLVEWDRDKQQPDKLVISDKYHSDIIDAVLYAYRKVLTWLYKPEPPKPVLGTPEYDQAKEDEMRRIALEAMKRASQNNDDLDESGWEDPWA
jgi:phage FluMu gp28-like protein